MRVSYTDFQKFSRRVIAERLCVYVCASRTDLQRDSHTRTFRFPRADPHSGSLARYPRHPSWKKPPGTGVGFIYSPRGDFHVNLLVYFRNFSHYGPVSIGRWVLTEVQTCFPAFKCAACGKQITARLISTNVCGRLLSCAVSFIDPLYVAASFLHSTMQHQEINDPKK